MQTQTNNIATPSILTAGTTLQTALPQAIRKANEAIPAKAPEAKINVRRKIYDVIKEHDAHVLVSELQTHLKPFGYNHHSVSAAVSKMFAEKTLLRSKLMPYAYWINPESPEPSDVPMRVFATRKPYTNTPVSEKVVPQKKVEVESKPTKGPQPAPLNMLNIPQGDALSVLGDMLDRTLSNDYSSLERDIDTISHYLTDQSTKFNSDEKDLAQECDALRTYAGNVGDHLESLRTQLRNVRLMAQLIRKSAF